MDNTNKSGSYLALIVVLLISGLLIWWVSSLGRAQEVGNDSRPTVVASVPHVAVWTQNLVGDQAQVKVLARGGVELHDFSLTPQDIETIAQADVIVKNGAGLEPWLENLEEQFTDKVFIDASLGLEIREGDPHVWLDPILVDKQLLNIGEGLKAALPNLALEVEQNQTAYQQKISALDQEIKTRLAQVTQKNFIAFHESFNYFAQRYGLNQVARLVERPGDQITLQEIQQVGDVSQTNNIHSLFIEPGPVPALALALADEFQLQLIILDPLETLPIESDSYIEHMQQNLDALVAGLR